jgi:hypothetical protein
MQTGIARNFSLQDAVSAADISDQKPKEAGERSKSAIAVLTRKTTAITAPTAPTNRERP